MNFKLLIGFMILLIISHADGCGKRHSRSHRGGGFSRLFRSSHSSGHSSSSGTYGSSGSSGSSGYHGSSGSSGYYGSSRSSNHYGSGSSGYHGSSGSSSYYGSSGSSSHYGSSESSYDRSAGFSSHHGLTNDGSSRLFDNDSPSSSKTTGKKASHIIPVIHSHPYHHTAYSHGSSNQVGEPVESTTSSVTNEPMHQNKANYPWFDSSLSLSDPIAEMQKILKEIDDENKPTKLKKNPTTSTSTTPLTVNFPVTKNPKSKTENKIEPSKSNPNSILFDYDDPLKSIRKVIDAIGLDLKI